MPTSSSTTKKPKRGRPVGSGSKLTPALQAKLAEILEAGNTINAACALVGISTFAFYDWMKKGEEELDEVYTNFSMLMKKALFATQVKMVDIVVEAAEKGTWQAAMTYLERRNPKEWARRAIEVQHTGKKGGPIQHNVIFRGSPGELAEAASEAVAQGTDESAEGAPSEEVGTLPGSPADD